MRTETVRQVGVRQILSLLGVIAAVLPLGACSVVTDRCERIIVETVAQVEGVESVDAVCRESFGSSGAGAGTVHLAAATEAEADDVIERIEEAMARNPEIESDWRGPSNIYLEDGTWFGMTGTEVRVTRKRLGIEP